MSRGGVLLVVVCATVVLVGLATMLPKGDHATLSPAGQSLVTRLHHMPYLQSPDVDLVIEYRRPAVLFRMWPSKHSYLRYNYMLRYNYLKYQGVLPEDRLDELVTALNKEHVFERVGEGTDVDTTLVLEDAAQDVSLWTRVKGDVPALFDRVTHDLATFRDPVTHREPGPVDPLPDEGEAPVEDGRR